MIYNDAYSGFAGQRHPELLGSKVREGWPEVADFNDQHHEGRAWAGRDARLSRPGPGALSPWPQPNPFTSISITRRSSTKAGNLRASSPSSSRPPQRSKRSGGWKAEREGLRRMFEQAPGFIAMLTGAANTVSRMVNAAYSQLIGHRDVVGKPIAEALPEIGGQGFVERARSRLPKLASPMSGRGVRVLLEQSPGAVPEERFLDFVYQPIAERRGRDIGHLRARARRHRAEAERKRPARKRGTLSASSRKTPPSCCG